MTQPQNDNLPYFDTLHGLIEHLHHESHQVPENPGMEAASVIAVMQGLCDVVQWLSNSASWRTQNMHYFDYRALAREIDDKVLWRLNDASSDDETVRDNVDVEGGNADAS